MRGGRTVGQAAAVAAVDAMLRAGQPGSMLLSGPAGVGKTTLALDLAARLLCTAGASEAACRACRACRLVAEGHHPDVHRIAPEGAGGQIRIDQVRALVSALALHSVEGGPRIAIVEHADRMNEDAQNALLKTLEEPPASATIVLCADDEDRLLPTIRSRVGRVRLGLVGVRDIESALSDLGLAQPPEAGRIARAAAGRPGWAIAYANAPEALAARSEIARTLVDLLSASRSRRLELSRDLLVLAATGAAAFDRATDAGAAAGAGVPGEAQPSRAAGSAGRRGRRATSTEQTPAAADTPPEASEPSAARVPAAERRRGLAWLIEVWTEVARDLIVVGLGATRRLRDPSLLDDLGAVSDRVDVADVSAFLERIAETSRRLESNVSPELALDVLVLRWPRLRRAA